MSNINTQSQDLFAIPGVSNLDQESAAAVSGGELVLSDLRNGKGTRKTLNGPDKNLGARPGTSGFNNKASWYEVSNGRAWIVYTGKNFTGQSLRLNVGKGNLPAAFNNNIESAKLA